MMDFRIADTFTDSLARLNGDEQKAVKTTAFDLQLNPINPGMQLHKIDKSKDKNFWSVRVSADIRLIVHKTLGSLLLCYVDHHDRAYAWAERRKVETHPKTGAAQLVEIRETIQEIFVPKYVEATMSASARRPLFAQISDNEPLCNHVSRPWPRIAIWKRFTTPSGICCMSRVPGRGIIYWSPASTRLRSFWTICKVP